VLDRGAVVGRTGWTVAYEFPGEWGQMESVELLQIILMDKEPSAKNWGHLRT